MHVLCAGRSDKIKDDAEDPPVLLCQRMILQSIFLLVHAWILEALMNRTIMVQCNFRRVDLEDFGSQVDFFSDSADEAIGYVGSICEI
jgi:hypothetical protein